MAEDIFYCFNQLKKDRFTGSLIVRSRPNMEWKFYFRLGRLLWATGGNNSTERWQRHLAVVCSQITPQQLAKETETLNKDRDYKILTKLHKQGSPIEKKQIAKLIVNLLSEVFFDIIQHGASESNKISYKTIYDDKLEGLIVLVDTEKISQKTKQTWQTWVKAGLTDYSPNLFPIIQKSQKYREEITSILHPSLTSLIDGKYNIRSLAAISKQDLVHLTSTLISLLPTGFVAFSPTSNNSINSRFSFSEFKKTLLFFSESDNLIISKVPEKTDPNKPLIVCIDDSPLIAQALGKFITQQGYRFISIKDPMNALGMLLKNPPDLIFLDLIMPVINGYELCAQLRRAPNLKNVPIVILTSKDGLVDRVRAKLVGGNGFLSKPVTREELLSTLEKQLKTNKNQ